VETIGKIRPGTAGTGGFDQRDRARSRACAQHGQAGTALREQWHAGGSWAESSRRNGVFQFRRHLRFGGRSGDGWV